MYKWVTTCGAVSYPAPPQLSQSSSSSPFSSSEFLSHLQIFSMETMVMSLSPIYLLFSLLTAVSCCCASNTLPSISSTSLPCSLRRCLVYARQHSVSIRNLSCKIGYICNLPLWTLNETVDAVEKESTKVGQTVNKLCLRVSALEEKVKTMEEEVKALQSEMKDQIEQHCKDFLTRQQESMKTDIVKAIDKTMNTLKTDIIEAIDAPRSYWVQTFPCVMFTNSPLWCTHFRVTYFKPVHACMHRSIMYIVMKIMSLDFLLWLYYQKWVWPDHGGMG